MNLRQRLIGLHVSFALFALLTAVVTIYAVQHQVERAALRFETLVDELSYLDDCRADVRSLDVHLHETMAGSRSADEAFARTADGVVTRLREVARFSMLEDGAPAVEGSELGELVTRLKVGLDRLTSLVRGGDIAAAQALFKAEIETGLLDRIDTVLRQHRQAVDRRRRRASLGLLQSDSQMLLLAGVVAVAGVALVVAGMLIVRRRLVQPIEALQKTARTFAAGDLTYRADLPNRDELGQLADALNGMAAALQRSQRKYQNLFRNLRDTVVICNGEGVIQEAHGGDAALLPENANAIVSRRIQSIWPQARFGELTWASLLKRVRTDERPVRLTDVQLARGAEPVAVVDLVAYRVAYAETEFAAIVFRDVADRRRLQRAAQRAETMEAAVTFARGIAHDFKNLLHSVQVSLAGISEQTGEEKTRGRATTAAEACRQAASLASRLTRFSSADEGEPEVLRVAETTRLILDAFDRELFAKVEIGLDLDEDAAVLIDRDHFTQILLNITCNALEAMPDGGALHVTTRTQSFANPLTGRPAAPHVVLSVKDSGTGMPQVVLEHVFEPLYSTKERSTAGPRGMGLAVVYAAVTHAGGFVQVESVPRGGTEVAVYLPVAPVPIRSPRSGGQRGDTG